MPNLEPLSQEQFRTRVLQRFRQPVRAVPEAELQRLLEDGVFRQSQFMAGYFEQFELIAARLPELAVNGQQNWVNDLLTQTKKLLVEALWTHQQSILDLPTATIGSPSEVAPKTP